MRFSSRAFGLTALLASAAVFSACSGAGNQATPNAGGASAASQARAVSSARIGRDSSVSRSKAIAGPVRDGGFVESGVRRAAAGHVVYDSIIVNAKGQTSSHIASLGFECCSTDEFGDGVVLTQGGRLKSIEVVMDSWACQTGGVYTDDCKTTPGAKFSLPITANVYSLTGYPSGVPTVGTLLATHTQTFNIPYRPSKNDKVCSGPNLGKFLGPVDKQCDHGLAAPITFNMNVPIVTLPSQVIVTVAFNTSDSGYNPIGDNTPCFASGNCPYDSLNVSAWGNGGLDDGTGQAVDPNGVFVNFTNTGFYCSPNPYGQPPGSTLALDTLDPSNGVCWQGYHPEIKVTTF